MKKTIKYLLTGLVAGAVLTFASCDDEKELPKIDGYNNSNEVAEDNLVAHWNFDASNKERLSNTEPSHTLGSVSLVEGQIGKALKLDKGALAYPEIAAINTVDALNNYTVSLWVNVENTKRVTGKGYTPFFGIIPTNTDFWGNIQATAETGRHLPSSDTLELKNYQNSTQSDGSQRGDDNLALVSGTNGKWFFGAKRWAHYVMTWNATTQDFEVYGDAVASGAFTKRTGAQVMRMRVPARAVFGSMASSDLGFPNATRPDWAPMATTLIDDVRVYNTVLSQAEITALFNLGTAGR